MRSFVLTTLARVLVGLFALIALSQTASSDTIQYSYDPLGRLVAVSDGNGQTANYSYDRAGNRTQVNQTVAVSAPTGQLSVGQTPITAGQSTTLTWSSQNATNATIDNGVNTNGATSGTVNVSPTMTTTYHLTVTGAGGTVSPAASVTVVVSASAPTGQLSIGQTPITEGQSTTLTWSSQNATNATIDNGVNTNGATSGTANVSPTTTTTYHLTVTGAGGTVSPAASVTVVVNPLAPTGWLSASPTSVALGGSSTLSWGSAHATSATLNGSSVAVSGSRVVYPNQNTTYTLVLTGPGGSYTPTPMQVLVQPPGGSFSAYPRAIALGASSTLSWTSQNATSATLNGSPVAVSGSQPVYPTQNTTYTLVLTGPSGSYSPSPVQVTILPPSGSLSASPTTILQGGSSTLSWSGSGATSASIDNGVGGVSPSSGTASVSPSSTTTYTLTLSGPGGTATPRTTITVNRPPLAPNFTITDNETTENCVVPGAVAYPLSYASDPDGDPVSIQSATNGSGGTTTVSGNSIIYTYSKCVRMNKFDSFTYTVSDGRGGTATGTVTVNMYVKVGTQ